MQIRANAQEPRVVLVTGAQSGIGAAIAVAFASAGTTVVVNWLDDRSEAEKVAGRIVEKRGVAVLVQGDVGKAEDVDAMFRKIASEQGRIDVLVNNAGIFPRKPFLDLTDGEWDRVLDVNLRGSFRCSRAAALRMVEAGRGGAIVNIASGAVRGKKLGVHYSASKGGMIAMTRSIALELAPHAIRVNAIAPGLVDTAQPRLEHSEEAMHALSRQVPLGRMGAPEDVADVAVFLASDAARHVTGQTIFVNGGSYMP